MKAKRAAAWIVIVAILFALVYSVTSANIGALPQPGRVETSIATRARDWLIARAARTAPPPAAPDDAGSISQGAALYGMDCASCHGQGGRNPAPIGRSMYPRVPDLGSPAVQSLSDRELFWVIKNGVRLSGMPGFGRIDTDQQIWRLAYYVGSLGVQARR